MRKRGLSLFVVWAFSGASPIGHGYSPTLLYYKPTVSGQAVINLFCHDRINLAYYGIPYPQSIDPAYF